MTNIPVLNQLWMMFFILISVLYNINERNGASLVWMGMAVGALLASVVTR